MKKAIFMLGLPGSGKTTYIKEKLMISESVVVSADEIRLTHPNYNPELPEEIHEECVKLAEEKMYKLAEQQCPNLIMDGGGINNKYTLRIISKLKKLGYLIEVVFINTPVNICLERNKERIKLNERFVPASVIIKKAYKLKTCTELLKQEADEFLQVDHFSNKNIFIDMDGVVAEFQDLPVDEYNDINFVSYGIFKHAKPVLEIITKLKMLHGFGKNLYILSASPNSICNNEKIEWISTHMPFIPQENIYFVGNKRFKDVCLRQLMQHLKLQPKDCMLIDDEHEILEKSKKLNVHAIHPSKFLTEF